MSDSELAERRIGTTLKGKWTLEKVLGVGGMASVYLGRHKIGRLDAIKVLHMDIAHSALLRSRFEQEARVVNSFRHKGAVEIRDIDVTEDGAPFLVMELLSGESLSQLVHRTGAIAPDRVLRIADETLDVLAAAHVMGIIHRDIKPDNLFLCEDGSVKVLDFGIARFREGSSERELKTKTGTTLGTASYMAPEQARGIDIDGRVDIYAVGATMFRVLTNRRVHEAGTQVELLMKLMSDPAPKLASVAPEMSPAICAVVDRALAFERNARYPDAKAMQHDVGLAMRGEMAAPPPEAPTVVPAKLAAVAPLEPTVATVPSIKPVEAATVVRDVSPPTVVVPPSDADLRASAPSVVAAAVPPPAPASRKAEILGFPLFVVGIAAACVLLVGFVGIVFLATSILRSDVSSVTPSATTTTVSATATQPIQPAATSAVVATPKPTHTPPGKSKHDKK